MKANQIIIYDWCPKRCKKCQQCSEYIQSPYYGYKLMEFLNILTFYD